MVTPHNTDAAGLSERSEYRTVFISDTHLGSRASRSRDLAAFLEQMHCEKLYLAGDIIDFWRLGNKPYWPPCHHRVLRRILKLVQQGTQVIFVPGNHDEAARRYCGMDLGGVQVMREDIHETADGRRLLVVHGDEFDLIVNSSRLLNIIGGTCYEWLVTMNRHYNNVRLIFGLPHRHFSRYIKSKVKSACKYMSDFESALALQAQNREVDGIVCGHIHKPEIREQCQPQYFNCGDWIEHCTALTEDHAGTFQLVRYNCERTRARAADNRPAIEPVTAELAASLV